MSRLQGPVQSDRLTRGVALGFSAEVLAFPAGLVTAAYLTRNLGPTLYGSLALVYAAVSPLMWIASTTFGGRVAVKLIADASDWRSIGAMLLRANALMGLSCAALFVLAAPFIAVALGDPT